MVAGAMATIDQTTAEIERRTLGVGRHVARAPATLVYVAILLGTTWLLSSVSPAVARRLLLESSTNLHHLARDPIRVLVSSAFWVGGWSSFVVWALLLVAVAAPVEHRIGTRRMTGVFAAGHAGATLVVALGLWIGIQLDAVERSVADAQDVGASYGFFAVAAFGVLMLRGRLRVVGAAPIVVFLAASIAVDPDFTAFGHLAAAGIGLALYALLGRRTAR